MMKKILMFTAAVLLLSTAAMAQDVILSQPYNNSLTVAPSFAGLTNGGRVALTYRNQYANIISFKTYSTSVLSADYFIHKFKSGVGGVFAYDVQGDGAISTLSAALQYNYRVKLGNVFFRPGVQLEVVNRALNPSKFVFAGDIAANGSILSSTSVAPDFDIESYTIFDAAFSSLFYNKRFWAGFNIDHLVPNNVSFMGNKTSIPMRYSLTGGVNWLIEDNSWRNTASNDITVATLIQHQGVFNQVDIGITWTRSILQLGAWYRGAIPISTVASHDAVILIAGLNLERFKVAYSYDITISSLGGASGGSHELSLQFFFNQKERSPMSFFCR